VICNASVHYFQVTATTSSSLSTFDRFHRPVVATTAGTGVRTGGTPLPLHMVGVTTTTAAKNMGAAVARTLRGSSFGHFVLAFFLSLVFLDKRQFFTFLLESKSLLMKNEVKKKKKHRQALPGERLGFFFSSFRAL